jgi:hypothetical protein
LTLQGTEEIFMRWSSGLPFHPPIGAFWWSLLLLASVIWIIVKVDRGGIFLLVQSLFPWAFGLGLSIWTGRPICHERYFFFAQFFVFAYWGIVCDRLPGLIPRFGFAAFLCVVNLSGLWTIQEQSPTDPPTLTEVASFLRDHYRKGDIVLTVDAISLNRFRCYASAAGMSEIPVRCIVRPIQPLGHVGHPGSLLAEEILWGENLSGLCYTSRIWNWVEGSARPGLSSQKWRETSKWHFGVGHTDQCALILYEPSEKEQKKPPPRANRP